MIQGDVPAVPDRHELGECSWDEESSRWQPLQLWVWVWR
jgi:hypothetical protein